MEEIRSFTYPIDFKDEDEKTVCEAIKDKTKDIKGITGVSVEDGKISYSIDRWASDYDVYVKIMEIADSLGVEILPEESEADAENESSEETAQGGDVIGTEEGRAEEKRDPKDDKKKDRKANFIEKSVVLGISLILIIVGALIGKHEVAQMWVYMIAFVFAGYEILYGIIVGIFEKKYVAENLMLVTAGFVLLYTGYRLSGCILVFSYSLFDYLAGVITDFVLAKADKTEEKAKAETDENVKAELVYRAEKLRRYCEDEPLTNKESKAKRLKYNLIIIAVGIIVAFVPPFFKISEYGTLLTEKYLYIGAAIVAFGITAEYVKSVFFARLFSAIRAWKADIYYESLSATVSFADKKAVVFDKTGVLTDGLAVAATVGNGEKAISLLKTAEKGLEHPIAKAVDNYSSNGESGEISERRVYVNGVYCVSEGSEILVGSAKFMSDKGISVEEPDTDDSVVYVAEDGKYVGAVILSHYIRANAEGMVAEIEGDTPFEVVMLSSDSTRAVNAVKNGLNIKKAVSKASANYKADFAAKNAAVYVGDDSADGETLGKTDCAIRLGSTDGSTVSIKGRDLKSVPSVLKSALRTKKTAKQNKIAAISKTVVLCALAAVMKLVFGVDGLWWTALINLAANCALVLNSARNLTETV